MQYDTPVNLKTLKKGRCIMKLTERIIVSKHDEDLFTYFHGEGALAEPLYNAALFRIRQIFCGWDKKPEERYDLEKQVFAEVDKLHEVYPNVRVRRVISYTALEKLMRVTENPDFFAGLPMQTAQEVLKLAVRDFKSWLKALKDYKQNPGKYLGRPKMPKYKTAPVIGFTFTNQDCVLYKDDDGRTYMKFPKTDARLYVTQLYTRMDVREVTVEPYYGKFKVGIVIEWHMEPYYLDSPDFPNMAGVDFGVGNIVALACTDQTSAVFKGGAIKSENQMFAKSRAHGVSEITKGTQYKYATSAHLQRLSLHHDCFLNDQLHKISMEIIRYCVAHKVSILVLGVNKLWKQKTDMLRKNNQNFVAMPHARLRWLIEYKALKAGIKVLEQEESYTSKSDITANDPIPVYGEKGADKVQFSGRRTKRGQYKCHNGLIINADCNGAANILRKAIPTAWSKVTDFTFLGRPASYDFNRLNPRYKLHVA